MYMSSIISNHLKSLLTFKFHDFIDDMDSMYRMDGLEMTESLSLYCLEILESPSKQYTYTDISIICLEIQK